MRNSNNSGITAAMQEALEIEKDDSVPGYDSMDELKKALLARDIDEQLKDQPPNAPAPTRMHSNIG